MNESQLRALGYIERSPGTWEKPRQSRAEDPGTRPRAVSEERAAVVPHEQEKPGVDASMHGQFRISVSFQMSDERKRDCDGGMASIFDALVACRRQLEGYLGGKLQGDKSPKR